MTKTHKEYCVVHHRDDVGECQPPEILLLPETLPLRPHHNILLCVNCVVIPGKHREVFVKMIRRGGGQGQGRGRGRGRLSNIFCDFLRLPYQEPFALVTNFKINWLVGTKYYKLSWLATGLL